MASVKDILIKKEINFMGVRKVAYVISGIVLLLSILSILVLGFNYGIDFAGGTLFQLSFEKNVDVGVAREVLDSFELGTSIIQQLSPNELLIRTKRIPTDERRKIIQALEDKFGKAELLRLEEVGPAIGAELRKLAIYAIIFAVIGILIYVAIRFDFKFSVVAVLPLLHDSLIVLGIFSLLHREINIPTVAAILTIIGYSLNDTIVILDRIRENLKTAKRRNMEVLVNLSLNQTLSRTLNTSLTTLIPVVILYFLGGAVLSNFALALFIGIIVGTYSSIFVASALLVDWEKKSSQAHKKAISKVRKKA